MYWKSNTAGWYWHEAPIETQALLIEAFSEITGDKNTIEELQIWLLNNKRKQDWNTTKATTEATYALLLQGNDWLSIEGSAKIKIGDADYEAAQVFNQIFGSGFAGRLFQNLREDKEYTYGAYGGIRANKLIGNFSSSAKVRNEVTDSAIDQFLLEINRIRNENVGAEELQNAKNYIAGTFAQSLESSRTVARFAANIGKHTEVSFVHVTIGSSSSSYILRKV